MKKLIFICLILALPKISFANERSIPLELFAAKERQHSGKLKVTGPMVGKIKELVKYIKFTREKEVQKSNYLQKQITVSV